MATDTLTETVQAAYARLGHQKFWNRIYGETPEGPTEWDIEDYADENGYTDLNEARAAYLEARA